MLEIRAAEPKDIPDILNTEKECFTSDAWCEDDFQYRFSEDGFITLCAFCDGEYAGYIAASLFGDLNIDSVAVPNSFRRKGIASALIKSVLESGEWEAAFLEVRESNYAARALYKKLGFQQIAVRKDYYGCPTENAIIMKAELYN